MTDARAAPVAATLVLDDRATAIESEREICDALHRGERREALALCVQRYGTCIGRLCMAMLGSQVDADDMTQETLLTAHQSFGEFRGDGSLRGWLLGIARNKCLQHLEKRRRRAARLRLVQDAEGAESAEDTLGTRKRAEQARALLERVRPSDRDALLLRYSGELSFKEVALACGIAEPAARKRVSRALLALRGAFAKKEAADD